MSLRDKYNAAIQTAKNFGMQGAAEEKDGKLHIHGTVTSEDQKNRIWDAIKTVPDYTREVIADIRVVPGPAVAGATGTGGSTTAAAPPQTGGAERTYTVKAGDTLSRIAKEQLGNANAYMDIFNANRDQLNDPDKIHPGQVLKIPAHAH